MPRPDPIVRARRVRLVDDEYPNAKRQRVAEYIVEHWNKNDGMQLTDIAEECDVSRQHVKNTLEAHFEIAEEEDGDRSPASELDSGTLEIVLQAYRLGYLDGQRDKDEIDAREVLRELLPR